MNKLTLLYYIPELKAEVEYVHFRHSNSQDFVYKNDSIKEDGNIRIHYLLFFNSHLSHSTVN